jgi:hypothetical protein
MAVGKMYTNENQMRFRARGRQIYLLNKNHVSAIDTPYAGSTGTIYKSEP